MATSGARPPAAAPAALLLGLAMALACAAPSLALRCIRCGEYTDGVGSITPCLNYTEEMHLKQCDSDEEHCVKYVTEASIVRECAKECREKEAWGTQVYCCSEDGCNAAGRPGAALASGAAAAAAAVLLQLLLVRPPAAAAAVRR